MFNEGLSLHKFAYMALRDHVIDVIDNDAILLQSTKANAKKVEECLIATFKIGVSCSMDYPPQRMKIEIVVIELQQIRLSVEDPLSTRLRGIEDPLCAKHQWAVKGLAECKALASNIKRDSQQYSDYPVTL
nr:protein kinase-like domain-containing protein [Tanacetum cinerariifolium]